MPPKKKKKGKEHKLGLPAGLSPTDTRNESGHTAVENAMCPDKKKYGGKPEQPKKLCLKGKGKKLKEESQTS